jgi:hypothetical protein
VSDSNQSSSPQATKQACMGHWLPVDRIAHFELTILLPRAKPDYFQKLKLQSYSGNLRAARQRDSGRAWNRRMRVSVFMLWAFCWAVRLRESYSWAVHSLNRQAMNRCQRQQLSAQLWSSRPDCAGLSISFRKTPRYSRILNVINRRSVFGAGDTEPLKLAVRNCKLDARS